MSVRWLAIVLLVGCSKPEAKKPIHVDVTFPDASAKLADDTTPPEVVSKAKAALEAVKTLASKCGYYRAGYESEGFERVIDQCGIWKKADVEALTAARKALDASAGVPDAGFGGAFVRLVDAFDDRSSKLYKNEQGYWAEHRFGAIAKYQEIALTWNDWRPASERVEVDVGTRKDYEGKVLAIDGGANGHIEWKNCSNGPCVILEVPKVSRK